MMMRDHEYPIQQTVDSLGMAVSQISLAEELDEEAQEEARAELESRVAELTYLVKHQADGEVLGVESVTALIAYGGPTEWVTFTMASFGVEAEVSSSWAPDSPGRLPSDVASVLADVWGVSEIFERDGEAATI